MQLEMLIAVAMMVVLSSLALPLLLLTPRPLYRYYPVSKDRPWQQSTSAGIVDYLDFKFSGLDPPQAVVEMNELKE